MDPKLNHDVQAAGNAGGGLPSDGEKVGSVDEKNGYAHYMLKEMYEQPRTLEDTLAFLWGSGEGPGALEALPWTREWYRDLERILLVGMGTARHAGLVAQEALRRLTGLSVEAMYAAAFRDGEGSPLPPGTLVVAISQSGETADTLAAVERAQDMSLPVLAVTNVVDSTLARRADAVLYTQAGLEVAVPSTKAYLAQLACLYALALHMGRQRGSLAEGDFRRWQEALWTIPSRVGEVLQRRDEVEGVASSFAKWDHAYFIGRGLDYVTALEGALKLKEVSYIHAEAYYAAEFKHGTLALLEPGTPLVGLVTQPSLASRMAANLADMAAQGAFLWVVKGAGLDGTAMEGTREFSLPPVDPLLAPLVATVPLQLLAYEVGRARGCDIDQPRNLTKSVTVE